MDELLGGYYNEAREELAKAEAQKALSLDAEDGLAHDAALEEVGEILKKWASNVKVRYACCSHSMRLLTLFRIGSAVARGVPPRVRPRLAVLLLPLGLALPLGFPRMRRFFKSWATSVALVWGCLS